MNVLDRNLDGCCVRGLPIGKPFRARFEVPRDYEANVTDTTDVFVLLRYKDMQGGEIIDLLSEPERQDTPSDTKENTLKRRILNRQNIVKEKNEKIGSDIEDNSDSDTESVTIEDLLELHIESNTGKSYYVDPDSNKAFDRSVESNCISVDVFHTGQIQTGLEGKSEEQEEHDEEILSGTDKIIEALLSRQTNDANTGYEVENDTKNADFGLESVIDTENERKENDKGEGKPHKVSKSKIREETIEMKGAKPEEKQTEVNRRKSHRLRSAGYRPNYEAMENSLVDVIINSDDNTDGYELDEKGGNAEKNEKSKNNDQDEKPDVEKLNTVLKLKISSTHDKIQKAKQKRKKRKSRDKGNSNTDDIDETNDELDDDTNENKRERKIRKRDKDNSLTDLKEEMQDNPDDTDIELNEYKYEKKGKRKPVKDGIKNDLDDIEDENQKERYLERKERKTRKKDEDKTRLEDIIEKPKRRRKPKEIKIEDDDSSQIESDPELLGLAPYKRNLLIAKKKKMLERQAKQATRIKVKLHEHPDKWRRDVMDSFMRKDRGKARYLVAVEMYVCTVCDKYKAESKESMENHIEMHVNGDLHCNQCSHVAVTNFELQKHKRDVHKKNIWICDICGLETIGREGLRDHLGKVHNNPQWSCKQCLKEDKKTACVTLHEYKKHLRIAHPDSMFQCNGCKRLFAQQHKLDNHLKLGCEGEGRKSYSCEKCGKVFSSHDSVKRHIMRVHNKERSFQCPYCPFTAARQTNLTSHLNVHEGKFNLYHSLAKLSG